jgi:hypothetical protein
MERVRVTPELVLSLKLRIKTVLGSNIARIMLHIFVILVSVQNPKITAFNGGMDVLGCILSNAHLVDYVF